MKKLLFLTVCGLLWAGALRAEIRLPDILSDNMVLQQQSHASLWGWAEPGSKITVRQSWSRAVSTTRCDSTGFWKVQVDTPAATDTPQTLSIRENRNDPVVIRNVLIGEVWFCSGQSNMVMTLGGYTNQPVEGAVETILRSGSFPNIRVASIHRRLSTSPQEIVDGRWRESTPANAVGFSATAYYFAIRLHEMLGVPVGVIVCSWGGSRIACWMPGKLLRELGYERVEEQAANLKPDNKRPTVMYNAMLYPLRHYTIRGFLWYQGCADVDRYAEYARYQSAMVKHWRELWGEGELPFYFVQIAPYAYGNRLKSHLLREAQEQSLASIPNSAMAATIDLTYPYEKRIIHPSRKREVGDRLALLALDHTYGMKGIESDNPRLETIERLPDGKVALSFTHSRNGFAAAGPITGFTAAGTDRIFHPARATLHPKENKVLLECPEVDSIAAIRYLFENCPTANLRNMWQLPVLPFRTDNWND